MIRFKINKSNVVLVTEWEEEPVKAGSASTAILRMDELRKAHGPEARIGIERDIVPPRTPQEWVRFIVTEKDGTARIGNAILKSKSDAVAIELARDYPNATIGRQEWVK